MRKIRRSLRIRAFSLVRAPLNVTLFSMALFLLTPTHPLGKETAAEIDQRDPIEAERIHETFKLYSILKSHGMDLGAASVWRTAATILEESQKRLLDPLLIVALINVESRFQHAAVSTEGARGLMQIHPLTAPALVGEVEARSWQGVGSLDDPVLNVKLGTYYLSQLRKRFRSLRLALSAYNLGPTEVEKRLAEGAAIPFDYAGKVFAAHRLYKQEERQAPVVLPIAAADAGGAVPSAELARGAGGWAECRQEIAYEGRESQTLDQNLLQRVAISLAARATSLPDRYGHRYGGHDGGGMDLSCRRANDSEGRHNFSQMTTSLG